MEMPPSVQPFRQIDVSGEFRVRVLEGTTCSVIVRADGNVLPHVRIEQYGDTIQIDMKPIHRKRRRRGTLRADSNN